MSKALPNIARIRPGLVNFPGGTPDAKERAELLLELDREKHHSQFGPNAVFHNHLSHHILAAYDLGAPPNLLQRIYDDEQGELLPIETILEKGGGLKAKEGDITKQNWTEFLGKKDCYRAYLSFFKSEVATLGAAKLLETYIFAPSANGNGSDMLQRFLSGAFHPLILTGYGAEFGSDLIVAQGLAQTAIHEPNTPSLFGQASKTETASEKVPLLEILRQVYDSTILTPVMPYDPDAFLSTRIRDVVKDGRPEEIKRLSALWWSSQSTKNGLELTKEIEAKTEELFWMSTLLFAATGKSGRKPRLDFFLMHVLNATLFIPSIMKLVHNDQDKVTLLTDLLRSVLLYVIVRGRPKIDAELIMTYTATPQPPNNNQASALNHHSSTLGSPSDPAFVNPWPTIVSSVLLTPDVHLIKAIRALLFAARKYGETSAGGAPGSFTGGAKVQETHRGMKALDGTIFVRAAGVAMDTIGWVTHGQEPGQWDRSALGWDEAWNDGK